MSISRAKVYTEEFKESAVKLAIGSTNPITQTARELGVKVSTLHTWISKHLKAKDPIIIKNNDNLHEELKRLKKEITQVTLERDILKKAAAYFAKRSSVKFAWINKHQDDFSIATMCKVIKVSRSGYYEWLNQPECNRAKQDQKLILLIKFIFEEGRENYGSRSIKKKLEQQGEFISRRRIVRLMKEANLICKTRCKFKATTDSKHKLPVAPNILNRQFKVDMQ